jgi:hypothetical protein
MITIYTYLVSLELMKFVSDLFGYKGFLTNIR